MSENARINVRIGGHEFNAEGPPEMVQAQYQQFLRAIQTPSDDELRWSLPEDLIERAFSRALGPNSRRRPVPFIADGLKNTGDYLSLVLYGALVFKSERDLSATELIPILRSRYGSGDEDRLDRVFNAHTGLIIKSGAKRGSRYGLTQAGVWHTEQLIEAIMSEKR